MTSESPTPVLLMAGVNRSPEPRRRKLIRQELEAVERGLRPAHRKCALRLVAEVPEEGIFLFDQFRQFQYQHELAIVHLSGYFNGRYLRFEGGLGEDLMDPIGFSDVLGRLPGLQVVFLAGCGHRELVEQLLLRDIPAVITLDIEAPGRGSARDIAGRFYFELLQGKSLREAWLVVQEAFAGKLVYRKVHYDLESNTLNWKGRDPDQPHLEWGLYVIEDNEVRLDWQLPLLAPSEQSSGAAPVPKSRPSLRKTFLVLSTLLSIGILAALLYHFDIASRAQQLFFPKEPCVFHNHEPYNVLQLPLHPVGDCKSTDPTVADAITRRLEKLADSEEGEHDFQVKYHPADCPVGAGEVEEMIRRCQADMVLWGEYDRTVPGEITFHFKYLYVTGELSLDRGQVTVRMPEEQLRADNDFINSGIEEVVFWARGNGYLSRQEYEKALKFFTKIREQNTESYLRVDVRMSQAYMELQQYDKALERFNHMLNIEPDNPVVFNDRGQLYFMMQDFENALFDFHQAILLRPDYADALYNRGLVFMQKENYSEAIADLQTVIRIQPSAARPYGALAAVYADLKDADSMYANLERALERGFDLNSLLTYYSAFGRYKQEDRFKALVEKYR